MYLVDKYGRRKFFIEAGLEMIGCMIVIGVILAVDFGHGKDLSKSSTPDSRQIKYAAQSIVVSVNMFFTAMVAQFFLFSLCHLKYGIFFLFGGFILMMTYFIYFLLPETKKVPIEEIPSLFEKHAYLEKIYEVLVISILCIINVCRKGVREDFGCIGHQFFLLSVCVCACTRVCVCACMFLCVLK
jgi:hypothetical protein